MIVLFIPIRKNAAQLQLITNILPALFISGINCLYDIHTQLKVIKRMKAALDKEGLKPYLMIQALGWLCPEVEDNLVGYLALPESPLGEYIF